LARVEYFIKINVCFEKNYDIQYLLLDFGAHSSSYPMGMRGSFPGGKAAGGVKLTTHLKLVLSSKNPRSYTSTPQYAFMAWCSVKVQGPYLTLPYLTSPT